MGYILWLKILILFVKNLETETIESEKEKESRLKNIYNLREYY